MPFKSEKQRKYMWAKLPKIVKDWTAKYGRKSKKELPNLPESQSDFWEYADTHSIEIKHNVCEHRFTYKSAREAECSLCGIGFYITKDWNIKKGRLYYKDELVT